MRSRTGGSGTVRALRLRDMLLAAYLAVAVLSLTGVLFRDLATRDGLVLGVPVGLAWVTGWALATFACMALYHVTRPERGEDAGHGDDSEGAR